MAISSFQLNINGDLYSAKSAEIDLFGELFFGLRTLTYKNEVAANSQYGQGQVAIGRTRGNYNPTASIELLKHEGDRFIARASARGQQLFGRNSYTDVPFNVGARLEERNPLGLSAVDILDAVIIDDEETIQTGGDAVVTKFTLHVIRPIRRTINGQVVTAVPDPLGVSIGGIILL